MFRVAKRIMEKCKDCLYWVPTESGFEGTCDKIKMRAGIHFDGYGTALIEEVTNPPPISIRGYGQIWVATKPDFGCVLFKNKKLAVMK